MKLFISIIISTLIASFTISFAEPNNIQTIKEQLIKYHDSGNYDREIAKKMQSAQSFLAHRIKENSKQKTQDKLAIVLDIDETSLSNYADMRKLNFGGTLNEIIEGLNAAHDPAIEPALKLTQYAINNNVAVFFITGRRENSRASTIQNLQKAGYAHWTQLYMAPKNYNQPSIVAFKSSTRKQIIDSGYEIVLNIGDQNSDLKGGFTDKSIKLPNPYYFVS